MFKFVAFFALIAYAHAAVSSDDVHAEVTNLRSDVRPDGYEYALDTTNHIHAVQAGDVHGNVHGDYEYISPEGVHVKVTYVANENGYQPQSDLLPTPPPIPAAILKSLAYIESHPPAPEVQHVLHNVPQNVPHVPHVPHVSHQSHPVPHKPHYH